MKQRIEHVITGLGIGGAELMLSHVARGGSRFDHSVTSLSSSGRIGDDLLTHGVPVQELGMKKNLAAVRHIRRLAARLENHQPQLVQTWLYHADLVGGLAARRAGLPVVWNLRQTEVDRGAHKMNTSMVIRLCAFLSRSVPVRIVCGSSAARESHGRMGFDESRMVVIRNGVDTRVFAPDRQARAEVRGELGVAGDALLVGRVGRYHPQKDYRGFVEAARIIGERSPEARFVLAGAGVDWDNRELAGWVDAAGMRDRFHLLGARSDVARVMAALDVFVSSSRFGEGFPNVIAEAMACGVPSVATDVGDSAEIVGREDRIVAPGDYSGLARAAGEVLGQSEEERRRDGAEGRSRVAARFTLENMINSYEALYDQVLAERGGQVPDRAAN